MSRIVWCHRLKKESEGLDNLPFPGPVGAEIFAKVSKEGWAEWREMQTKIINEYRLDLSESDDRNTLMQQMRNFLSLDNQKGDEASILHVGTPTYDETKQ